MKNTGYAFFLEHPRTIDDLIPLSWYGPHNWENEGMTPLFYEYVQQNRADNYAVPWSVWLEEQEALFPAA